MHAAARTHSSGGLPRSARTALITRFYTFCEE